MSVAVGLTVTLRVRMGAGDARLEGGLVDGPRLLQLFADVAAELLVRLDGDEGYVRTFEAVEFLAPLRVGEYVEATGVVTEVGATTRVMAFEARKVVAALRSPDAAPTAADALPEPVPVCRALGTCVVPHDRQRRPRLVLPALTGPPPEHAKLPEPRPVVTPAPHVIVTPPSTELIVTASVSTEASGDRLVQQLVDEAVQCREAGAAVLHVLASPHGSPAAASREALAAAIAAVREATDLVVEASTWDAADAGVDARAVLLGGRPDLATLPCGVVGAADRLLGCSLATTRELARRIEQAGAAIELECHDAGHVDRALALMGELALPARPLIRFVLGTSGGIGAREDALRFLVAQIPAGMTWGVAAASPHQLAMARLAIRTGGHVRVGVETDGGAAAVSAEGGASVMVAHVVEYARRSGREVVEPARARRLLGLTRLIAGNAPPGQA